MRNLVLVGLALAMTAGFVYLNDYQQDQLEMMQPRSDPRTRTVAVDLRETAAMLRARDMVIVPVTRESQAAVARAARANPDAKVWELGVVLEDLTCEVRAEDASGRSRPVAALVVLTEEADLSPGYSFRTDTPLGALEYVRDHHELDYLVLNPEHGSNQGYAAPLVLGPEDIEALIDLLTSSPG